MKIFYIVLIGLFTMFRAYGQQEPDIGLYNVHISDTAHNMQIQVIPVKHLPRARTPLFYYWYASNRIHIQQGGYSGKLLNGSYTVYDKDRNVREQGNFNEGLKDGDWKIWNAAGLLVLSEVWDKGTRDGPFTEFDGRGRPARNGYYKKDLLDGVLTTRTATDSLKYTRYKQGVEVTGKSKSFLRKLNFFRKRDTTGTSSKH